MIKRTKMKFISGLILTLVLLYLMVISVVATAESSKGVDLTINGETETIITNERTVEGVLNSVDYEYKETDRVNPELNDRVLNEMEIVVSSEKEISLSKKGDSSLIKTNAITVAELLNEVEIKLGADDIVIPSLNSNLQDGDEVAVIYQKEEEYKETVDVNYETEKKFSIDVPFGEEIVEQEGVKGIKEETYNKTIKNDIVISDELTSEEIINEPIVEKIIVGTKEVVLEEISNETIVNDDSSIYVGDVKTIEEGSVGSREKVYENDGNSRELISNEVKSEPVNRVVHEGTKERPSSASSVSAEHSLSEFQYHGVINSMGKKFTYYSQSVLPGGGLKIPGRHVNGSGYVADEDGYIVVASNISISKGTVIDTPFGYKGKVYDVCEACTIDWFDIYTK